MKVLQITENLSSLSPRFINDVLWMLRMVVYLCHKRDIYDSA